MNELPAAMEEPQPPVFAFSDDVVSFDTLSNLLRYVEPMDVDRSLRVFDARGRELVLRAVDVQRLGLTVGGGRVEVIGFAERGESTDAFTGLLRSEANRLQRHLGARWTTQLDLDAAQRPELIEAVHPWTRMT